MKSGAKRGIAIGAGSGAAVESGGTTISCGGTGANSESGTKGGVTGSGRVGCGAGGGAGGGSKAGSEGGTNSGANSESGAKGGVTRSGQVKSGAEGGAGDRTGGGGAESGVGGTTGGGASSKADDHSKTGTSSLQGTFFIGLQIYTYPNFLDLETNFNFLKPPFVLPFFSE